MWCGRHVNWCDAFFFFMLCHVTSCNVLSCDALPCDSLSQMKRPAQCAKQLVHLRVRALDLICSNVSVTSHAAHNHITAPQVTSQLTTLLHQETSPQSAWHHNIAEWHCAGHALGGHPTGKFYSLLYILVLCSLLYYSRLLYSLRYYSPLLRLPPKKWMSWLTGRCLSHLPCLPGIFCSRAFQLV